ncbi:hypothetical protein KNJ79_05325 [Sphingopyxis indica]|uniref:hypothetical protein n=1 Tax=Sphingopyxis indica TaxID=436663 RepID=UPI002938E715|nr:hypothetical protein [Sphingopyxis indica]WOF44354.1 hypothetical protein KNJ79_05325 [Sphingopyxis indica]
MTPELAQLIKDRVGSDIDPTNFAVFEAIALNTKPLRGKDGTLHERAVVAPVTLRQMADHIKNGGHLPLISDHQLTGEPQGRVFDAELLFNNVNDIELRVLFYLDPTESRLISKLNAGSLDEVSVSFFPTQFLCSECGWDYLSPEADYENFFDRTCANGHTIGEDGVHADLVGLSDFIEVSLVARGAADQPRIVGKSDSKLQPASSMRLAAHAEFKDRLIVQASRGEDPVSNFDPTALVTELSDVKAEVKVLKAAKETFDATITSLTGERDTALTRVTELTAELETANTELETAKAESKIEEAAAALSFMQTIFCNLTVASGKEKPKDDELPTTVAELEKEIKAMTSDLTSILPVGGTANPAKEGEGDAQPKLVASAYTNRKL